MSSQLLRAHGMRNRTGRLTRLNTMEKKLLQAQEDLGNDPLKFRIVRRHLKSAVDHQVAAKSPRMTVTVTASGQPATEAGYGPPLLDVQSPICSRSPRPRSGETQASTETVAAHSGVGSGGG